MGSFATLGADAPLFVEMALRKSIIAKEIIMRILVTALFALSVLVSIAAPASAFDAKSLFGQLDHESGGTSGSPVHKSGLVPMAPE